MQLNDAFLQFAAYGTRQPETQMDGKNFSKLCKDCGLIDKKFSLTDADLTFSKVKNSRMAPPLPFDWAMCSVQAIMQMTIELLCR